MYKDFRYYFIAKYPKVCLVVLLILLAAFFLSGGPFFIGNLPPILALLASAMQGYLIGWVSIHLLPGLLWITIPKKKEDKDEM